MRSRLAKHFREGGQAYWLLLLGVFFVLLSHGYGQCHVYLSQAHSALRAEYNDVHSLAGASSTFGGMVTADGEFHSVYCYPWNPKPIEL